jgi:RNA polymerase sigma factor (TIGR02999 family)
LARIVTDTAKPSDVTVLLQAWRNGDPSALERLTAIVHDELQRIARHYMRDERLGHTLQTTALVNEVYLRLVDVEHVQWQHRAQFFAISAKIMRNILVDAARARESDKRGGGWIRVDVEQATLLCPEPAGYILALHDALTSFAQIAPRQAKVVELRFFGGLSEEEAAEVLNTSARTVRRDWEFAKAWLQRELRAGDSSRSADRSTADGQ